MNTTTIHGRHRQSAWLGFRPVAVLLALLALLVVLAACGGTEPEAVATTEPAPTVEATEPEPEPVVEETTEPEPTDNLLMEYPLDIEWEDSGLTISVTSFSLADRYMLEGQTSDEFSLWVEEDTATVLGLEISITNATGTDLEFYPEQSQLVIGKDQFESSMMLSDEFPSPIRDGVTVDGWVLFESKHDITRYKGAADPRWTVYRAVDADTWDDLTDDIDLTIRLGG